ncbi:E3 ubiquitin-protein ligase TRIM11, partial [Ophiophagus hannah]
METIGYLRGAMATADAAGAAASLLPSTVCEVHNKPLEFFCQNELALICTQCAKSKKHHTHTVLPIQEAAQKNKVSERLAFLDNAGISLVSHSRYVLKRGKILHFKNFKLGILAGKFRRRSHLSRRQQIEKNNSL